MSVPTVKYLEKKGIVLINDVSKGGLKYECFVCGCKLRSQRNALTHTNNDHHVLQLVRFSKYFTINETPNSLGKTTLSCKFCNSQLSWEESKKHIQKHNIPSWIKPDDLPLIFFRHFISQHRNFIFKCNLCDTMYGHWFHAMEHIKESAHIKNWHQTSAPTANYALYENTHLQFYDLISNRVFIGESNAKAYHCHTCNLSFANFQEANNHIQSTEHRNFLAIFLEDIFHFKTEIPKAMKWIKTSALFVVMKDKIYCKVCDLYLKELSEISPHMVSHSTGQKITSTSDNVEKEQKDLEKNTAAKSQEQNLTFLNRTRCDLKIPDNLKWVIKAHNVVVKRRSLYCSVCNKTLNNNSAVEVHLQKHLESTWQEKNLPPDFPRNAVAAQYKELAEKSESPSPVASSSGISTKRIATNNIDAEQIKIQKIDHPTVKPAFKNVGNYIQILPQNSQIIKNPVNKSSPLNKPGILGAYPAVITTPTNSSLKPCLPLQNRPNLVDLMKKSIPSLMNKPVQPPNNLQNSTLFNKTPLIQPVINQAAKSVTGAQPVNNLVSNQVTNQPINNLPMRNNPIIKPPLNAFPMNTYPLNSPLTNPSGSNQLNNNPPNNLKNDPVKNSKNNSGKKNLLSQNLLMNTSAMMKLHKANYLFFKKNEIYSMHPEKRRKMILSSQLSFFVRYSMDYFIYCVVCEKSIAYNLQNIYEHWCSSQHNEYLEKMEEDDKQFNIYPNQFSCLALSKEFMIENQDSGANLESYLKEFTCCACDVTVRDQDSLLREHFQSEKHQLNVQKFRKHSEEICKKIFPLVESSWYSIDKYSCWPCQKNIANEVPFAEHLESKKHQSTMQAMSVEERKKYFFDSCAVCGLLWFGDQDEYPKHCYQDPIHKDLTKNIENRIDYLSEEASNLLSDPEMVISKLLEEVNKLRFDQGRESELIRSLELAVRRKFPNAKAYAFGSRVTGLGFPSSDIDIFLDCGGSYEGQFCHSIDLIDSIHHCLKLDSQAWNVEKVIESSRTPIIKVYHSHSQLKCDVSFSNGLSVENTKLLKTYLDAYPQCKEMILFLKKWLEYCGISGSRCITNYAMSWFVIFYLQMKSILPSVASLMKNNPRPKAISGWHIGIREFAVPKSSLELKTKELLKGFFAFYAEFNYRFNIACPLLGVIKSKKDFLYLPLLPDEMKTYVQLVSTETDPEFFRIDSPMCIQDPYDLSHNLTKGVKKIIVNRFRKLCAKSAKLLSLS